MAREGDSKSECVFTLKQPYNCQFRAVDFGDAGVKLEISEAGDFHAVLCGRKSIEQFIRWLCRTSGQLANVMPIQMIEVLTKVVDRDKTDPFLNKSERRVLRRSLKVLRAVNSETADGKKNSRVSKAIRMRYKSVTKKNR